MKVFKVAALASVFAFPVMAADMPVYAPPVEAFVPVSTYDWTGFYAGVHVGYGWGENDAAAYATLISLLIDETSIDSDGFFGGAQIGFNMQSGNWVFGLEGDFSGAAIEGDARVAVAGVLDLDLSADINWLSTVRGRVGYAFDTTLLYLTGGLAIGEVEVGFATPNGSTSGSDDDVYFGFAVGAGIEHAFSDRVSAKLEYLYVDLGEETFVSTILPVETEVGVSAHTIKAGLNYRF